MKFKVLHKTLEEYFGKAKYFQRFHYQPAKRDYEFVSRAQIDNDLEAIEKGRKNVLIDSYRQSMN